MVTLWVILHKWGRLTPACTGRLAPPHSSNPLTARGCSMKCQRSRARFVLSIVFLLLVGSALGAQGPRLDPNVAFVSTGGFWSRGDSSGVVRVVVVNGGREHVTSRVFVEWVGEEPRQGSWVVESLPVETINHPGVWSVGRPSLGPDGSSTVVCLSATNPYDGSEAEFLITVRQPGHFDVRQKEVETTSANQRLPPVGCRRQ